MAIVTSTEFRKHFAHFCNIAQREPVIITERKHEALIVFSYDEYSRLKALDARQAYRVSEMPDDLIEAVKKAEPPQVDGNV